MSLSFYIAGQCKLVSMSFFSVIADLEKLMTIWCFEPLHQANYEIWPFEPLHHIRSDVSTFTLIWKQISSFWNKIIFIRLNLVYHPQLVISYWLLSRLWYQLFVFVNSQQQVFFQASSRYKCVYLSEENVNCDAFEDSVRTTMLPSLMLLNETVILLSSCSLVCCSSMKLSFCCHHAP